MENSIAFKVYRSMINSLVEGVKTSIVIRFFIGLFNKLADFFVPLMAGSFLLGWLFREGSGTKRKEKVKSKMSCGTSFVGVCINFVFKMINKLFGSTIEHSMFGSKWLNPAYGVVIFAAGIPWLPDTILLLVGVATLGLYCLRWIVQGGIQFKKTPVNGVLFAMGIIFFVNTVLSIDVAGSFRDFVLGILGLGLVFVLVHGESDKKVIKLAVNMMIISSLFTCFHGIYQYLSDVPMKSGWVDASLNANLKVRVFSTFENPNLYAEYLIMIIPLSISCFFAEKKALARIFYFVAGMLQVGALAITYSRGGFIGLVAGLGVYVILLNWKLIFAFVPAGFVGLALAPDSIIDRIKSIGDLNDSSNFYRYNIWTKSVEIVKEFWSTGVGLGFNSFRAISPYYITTANPYHAHNTYLELTIEIGLIGLCVFLLMFVQLFRMTVRMMSSLKPFNKYIAVGTFAGIVSIMVHGVAEHVLYNPKVILSFWLMVGINCAVYETKEKK